MSKRRPPKVDKLQRALNETLSLLGEQSREAVLLYLEKYHNISIDGTENFTEEKFESAFDTLFGSGQLILMRKFSDEVKKGQTSNSDEEYSDTTSLRGDVSRNSALI